MEDQNQGGSAEVALYNAISDHVAPELMALDNVFSVGVGPEEPGSESGELCILVLVDATRAAAQDTSHIPASVEVAIGDLKLNDPAIRQSGTVRARTRVISMPPPEVEIMKGAPWNINCVGGGTSTDVYYGMPIFDRAHPDHWIGTGGIILKDKNNRKVLLSNRHVLNGHTHIYNRNGKLIGRGVVESAKLDAAYTYLEPGLTESRYFYGLNRDVDKMEIGEGYAWHLQFYAASTGYKDFHMEGWNLRINGAPWTDPNYSRWRLFKDWTPDKDIPVAAHGDSGSCIVGNGGGLNTLTCIGDVGMGNNCQNQPMYRYLWALPIEDVMKDLGLSIL